MTINSIRWPELIRIDTMELPMITLLSGVGGTVVCRFSRPLGLIIFAPGLLCLTAVAVTVILNEAKRLVWLRHFDRVSTMWMLSRRLRKDPERYELHYNYYGGFDAVRSRPAVVIEDSTTHSLIAVYPGSYGALEKCRRLGLRDREHEEDCRVQQRSQMVREARSRCYDTKTPLRRKRLNHYADVICKMFMGWRMDHDSWRLERLPTGRLTIDLISCKTTHDSYGPMKMYVADSIHAWLQAECAKEAIPFNLLRRITLTVDIDVSPVETPRKKVMRHSFHIRSVIATDAREYRGETKESYDRLV